MTDGRTYEESIAEFLRRHGNDAGADHVLSLASGRDMLFVERMALSDHMEDLAGIVGNRRDVLTMNSKHANCDSAREWHAGGAAALTWVLQELPRPRIDATPEPGQVVTNPTGDIGRRMINEWNQVRVFPDQHGNPLVESPRSEEA